MSNDLPQDIRRIIAAQSEVNLPRSITLPVLPKIGHVAGSKSSTKDESERMKQNTSNSLEPTPAQKLPRLLGADKMHLVEPRRIAPILHPRSRGDDFKFNYSFIPNRETLQHPYSTTRESVDSPLTPNNFLGPSRFDKTFVIREETPLPSSDSISLLDLKLASIPHSLPDMLGLQNAVDNLSNRRVANILDACRLYDRELRGYLCVPSLIKCFGEIIPSVHSPSSPWRLFLQSLAPDGEFVEYEKLIQLVQRHRHDVNIEETISDLLVSTHGEESLPLRASSGQENRQRTRAQVVVHSFRSCHLTESPRTTHPRAPKIEYRSVSGDDRNRSGDDAKSRAFFGKTANGHFQAENRAV